MATKEELKEKEFDKKFLFFGCNLSSGCNHGTYKNWDIRFLLLTKKEKEQLIKQTYNRMRLYNKMYKPKSWCGYTNEKGEEIE